MTNKPPDLDTHVLDAIDAGLVLVGHRGEIRRWNAWMAHASGKAVGDVLGRTLIEVFPDVDLHRLLTALQSAMDSGASTLLTHALHPGLLPLKTRAGRQLLHDVTISSLGMPSSNACLIYVANVTMAAERERFLRARQNARYDALVHNASDVILTLDGEQVIRHANPSSLQFGYDSKELVGQTAALLFDGQDAWTTMWQRLMGGQTASHHVELVARRKDQSLSYFEASASRWQNDSRVFVTAILRDIDERRAAEAALRLSESRSRAAADAFADLNATLEQRVEERTSKLMLAEEALRQSQKMEAIGQLTGGIAHDFNNLLQGITGTFEIIRARLSVGRFDDVDRFLQGGLRSASRAAALTHRLLAFSRQQPIAPRPLAVNLLIESIEDLIRRSIGETLAMSIALKEDLWLVRCDANQLENAVLNLAINSRDAMPNGGKLTIETSNTILGVPVASTLGITPGEYVRIGVSDTGTGMAPEVQARAFDPFFTTKPIGRGTGLGLSMIYGFVRQSGGSVRIESELERGTTISIFLPRFSGSADESALVTRSEEGIRAATDEIVLVVEDDEVVRLLAVEVLKSLGYVTLEATDGVGALDILQSTQRIDLLISDIGLPDINGRKLIEEARKTRPDLKALFMTGYAAEAADSAFLGSGMEIISKPFDIASFAKHVKTITGKSSQ